MAIQISPTERVVFLAEYQNQTTNWAWSTARYTPSTPSDRGIIMHDDFVIPDYSPTFPFFTWSNFRIKCLIGLERINLWAAEHDDPTFIDPAGLTFQSGDEPSTWASYLLFNDFFRDSERTYFWIKAINETSGYTGLSQELYDPAMGINAVSSIGDILPPTNEEEIINNASAWLGWDPVIDPLGGGSSDAWAISTSSDIGDIARWIMAWDNACVNLATAVTNPAIPGTTTRSIGDVYQMIENMPSGTIWMGCGKNKYIYGKVLYSLEDHDFLRHKLKVTLGKKAWGVEIYGLDYGG